MDTIQLTTGYHFRWVEHPNYSYVANSSLVGQIVFKNGSNTRILMTKQTCSVKALISNIIMYLLGAGVSLSNVRGLNSAVTGRDTDDGAVGCFFCGAFMTTVVVFFLIRKISNAKNHLLISFLIGVLAYVPGYFIIYILSKHNF